MKLTELLYEPIQAVKNMNHYDYASTNLRPVPQEIIESFPHVERVVSFNKWVPHTARQDRRYPKTGLLTWDEATLMYNYGLNLAGKSMLEIGCWVGWSTVVLGLTGVELTVIDPVLQGMPQGEACREAVAHAGVSNSVTLLGGYSPGAVTELGAGDRRWSAFFIDGNHEGDAPLLDAQECMKFAEDDCIMLFHDVIQPNIAEALKWVGDQGWHCGIHYTSQFIGVAWRGNMKPLPHIPDPRINWEKLVARRWPHCRQFARL